MLIKLDKFTNLNSYKTSLQQKDLFLKEILKLNNYHKKNSEIYKNIVKIKHKGRNKKIEDLPFLPTRIFKNLNLKTIKDKSIFKILESSGTDGNISKIFLDIDEDLRRFFKIRRDVFERGHTIEKVLASLEARQADLVKFISPQSNHAEILMSLKPLNIDTLNSSNKSEIPRLKLAVTIRNSYNEISLQRVLVGICGLHVDLVSNNDGSETTLTIEGDSKSEDMAQAAVLLCPETLGYLDETPEWEDGMLGIMQIIVFAQISQLITKSLDK